MKYYKDLPDDKNPSLCVPSQVSFLFLILPLHFFPFPLTDPLIGTSIDTREMNPAQLIWPRFDLFNLAGKHPDTLTGATLTEATLKETQRNLRNQFHPTRLMVNDGFAIRDSLLWQTSTPFSAP